MFGNGVHARVSTEHVRVEDRGEWGGFQCGDGERERDMTTPTRALT